MGFAYAKEIIPEGLTTDRSSAEVFYWYLVRKSCPAGFPVVASGSRPYTTTAKGAGHGCWEPDSGFDCGHSSARFGSVQYVCVGRFPV